MATNCESCAERAQGQMVTRKERISWTVDTLQGIRPATTEEPEKIKVNVDHTLHLAKERHEARNDLLPDDVNPKEWDELGTAQKIELVQTLIDFWPKEGVAA